MPIILRILGTYKCLYGKTSRICGLKYQSEATIPVRFGAPRMQAIEIEEISNINKKIKKRK